ncbi:MAG: hypothetical protein WC081_04025 [Candidatus Ratteibacteria bacterium]|jgi:multidrug transporter EmrE-like cation transporter
MWINIILVAMIANGIALASMKAVHQYGYDKFIPFFLFCMYTTSTLISRLSPEFKKPVFDKKEVFMGLALGVSVVAGMVFVTLALRFLPGCVVYSVVNGGAVVLVSIAAALIFREKYSIFGILGIISGVVSVFFLSLK